MRKRVAGYITTEHSNEFGLDVKVQRSPFPKADMPASGDPVPEGQQAGDTQRLDFKFRNPIPPGEIGSEETEDVGPLAPSQFVDTVQMYNNETRAPDLHGSVNSLRTAQHGDVQFNEYASFQPRRAPMPINASDSVFLPGYGKNVADPRMSDKDVNKETMLDNGRPDRVDLFGKNRDGMAHNENGHPGFAKVQSKIAGEGYSKKAAGAILASATRNASKAAHKSNPRLNKVKG